MLVVAGDTLARAGLAAMLERESGCEVVGQVPDGPDVSSDIDTYRPDAVVWDLGWNPDSAADSLGDASEAGIPIVALVSHEDQVADAWNAGARGVLLRDADGATLLLALSAVSKGLAVLPSQAGAVAVPSPEAAPEPVALTPRELAVLKLLAGRAAQQDHRPTTDHQRAYGQVSRQLHPRQAGRSQPDRSRHTGDPSGPYPAVT